MSVLGDVESGFDAVVQAFEHELPELLPGGAALSVRVDGEPVVDLWCGEVREGVAWRRDTLGILGSATKGLATMAVQVCVDRGLLDVESPVARVWPEFSAGGKEAVTVAQVLSHTVGLTGIPGHTEFMWPDGRGWDAWDEITSRLAAATPSWEPGSRTAYHGFTFGWLVGEIVQRASGTPISEFVAEQIAAPLGVELVLGRAGHLRSRVAEVHAPPRAGPDQPEVQAIEARLLDASDPLGEMMLANGGRNLLFELEEFLNGGPGIDLVLPSSTAVASAAAFADAYAAVLDGRLVKRETMMSFASERAAGPDVLTGGPLRWGLGYMLSNPPHFLFGSPDGFGHTGYGGQVGWADPRTGVSFAFVRSRLGGDDVWTRLAEAVMAASHRT